MPKGIEVVGGIARGLAQGYSTGARLANQRQALELREQQLGMQQDAYAREIAEAERIAAEQQQMAGLEGQQFAEQARDPQSIENIRHHLKERDPNLVRADKQHAAVTEALPHLQGALSGTIEVDGLRIPSAIGQLTMEQAPSFKAADEYIRRLETTISNIRSPEARQMYVDRQWGILENNAFQREMQQVRSDYQRDIELGAGHDITEPGSDQFATNPEMAQHGFQVLDQIASLAGQSGDPRDIQAARGALLEYRQAWEHAKGQLAQKRAAAQQQVLQRQQQMAGVQALMQAGQHELAGRLLAEIEGQSANALFGSADYSQGGAAFAQSRMAGGGAMSAPTGGPAEGARQAAAAPSPGADFVFQQMREGKSGDEIAAAAREAGIELTADDVAQARAQMESTMADTYSDGVGGPQRVEPEVTDELVAQADGAYGADITEEQARELLREAGRGVNDEAVQELVTKVRGRKPRRMRDPSRFGGRRVSAGDEGGSGNATLDFLREQARSQRDG